MSVSLLGELALHGIIGRAATPPSYAYEVLADAPLGYWQLEETSGSTVADSSSNSYTGTVSGVDLDVSGPVATGSAGSFDGVDDHIDFGTSIKDAMNGTAFTCEAIVKPTSSDAGTILGLDLDTASGSSNDQRSWVFSMSSTGKLRFIKIANGVVDFSGSTSIDDGNFHHVAATYDGSDIRLYVDGVLDDTTSASGSTLGTETTSLWGGSSARSGAAWDGILDELAVYTTALSGSRILAHAEAAGLA